MCCVLLVTHSVKYSWERLVGLFLTNLARLKIKKGSAVLELAGILNAVVQKDIPSFYI